MCIEDAQRLDEEVVGRVPVTACVVAAVRLGAPLADAGTLSAVAARSTTRTIALEPLRTDDVAAILGRAEQAAEVTALTGGNALLTTRLAAALDDNDDLASCAEALAGWVARYWSAELHRLPPAAKPLVDALLVVGDEAPLWLAAEVADLKRDEAARAADSLVLAGLLAKPDPAGRRMPLVWQVLDAAGAGAVRAGAHSRAAKLLARTEDGLPQAAEHLMAIPPVGEPWAAEVLRDAAREAAETEHDRCIAWLDRSLKEPVAPELRTELLLDLGAAHERAGSEGAADAYRQALRVAPERSRRRVHLLLGRHLFGRGDYRASALELDRALAIDGPDDELRIELLSAYVAAARFDRTLEDAAALHLSSVLDSTLPGRTAAERALLAEVALEHGIRARPRDSVIGLAQRAWADGLLLEGADVWGITISQVAAALTWSDAFVESDDLLTATIAHAEEHGQELLAATARYLRAWPRYYLGALDDSEADVRAALDASGWEMYEPSARAILGHVLFERGAHAEARDALVLSNEDPWRRTVPFAMLLETRSRLHVAAGDLAAAAEDLEEAGALLDTMGNRSPFCPWRSRLATVHALQGDITAADAIVALELDQAQAIGTPRALGVALHARGVIAHLAKRPATEDLQAAVEALGACGARVDHARALAALGAVLADEGRRAEAREPLRAALDLARTIGAQDIAERAARDLRRAGGRPPEPQQAIAGLTTSELRVARLAAQGHTNRQIADDLVVSSHTVRFHLTGVYRKLGVASRDELAAALRAANA